MIQARDVANLCEVPLALEAQNLSMLLLRHFDLEPRELGPEPPLAAWQAMVDHMLHATETIRVAVAGKYTKLSDAYLSLLKVCFAPTPFSNFCYGFCLLETAMPVM